MRTRFICPFCREAVAEFDSGYDPEAVEARLALHLEAWHPIRRRLSRRVRTALREIVPTSSGWIPPRPTGPTGLVGPTGPGGPTGAVPLIEHVGAKGKPDEIHTGYGTIVGVTGVQPGFVGFRDGEWYAFRLLRLPTDEQAESARRRLDARAPGQGWSAWDARDAKIAAKTPVDVYEFFAVAAPDPTTGFLELREIPDPWICRECGLGYQEGAHTEFGFTGPDAHDYVARGAPGEEPES